MYFLVHFALKYGSFSTWIKIEVSSLIDDHLWILESRQNVSRLGVINQQ